VESLHTIAESLPGLLAEGSPSAVRAAMMANSAHQGEESNVRCRWPFACPACWPVAEWLHIIWPQVAVELNYAIKLDEWG
jgi:hypothetical protein